MRKAKCFIARHEHGGKTGAPSRTSGISEINNNMSVIYQRKKKAYRRRRKGMPWRKKMKTK